MTLISVVTTKQQFGQDTLSITARNVSGENDVIQSALIIKTVKLWLYLRDLIDKGERTTPLDKTPEMAVGNECHITFEPWQETRVTVFDWSNRYGLTIHSDTMAQNALDIYWGMQDALQELKPSSASQNAPIHDSTATNSSATQNQVQTTTNTDIQRVSGKKAAKELTGGSKFVMPIAKIEAGMSKSGILQWELFGFYGGNPGKYADLVVYSDNEVAQEKGLVTTLESIVSKAGQSVTGKWLAGGIVADKGDGKALYVVGIEDAS